MWQTTQYIKQPTVEFLSDHMIIMTVVQKRLKIVRLKIEYMALLSDNEKSDNETVSEKWQCNATST